MGSMSRGSGGRFFRRSFLEVSRYRACASPARTFHHSNPRPSAVATFLRRSAPGNRAGLRRARPAQAGALPLEQEFTKFGERLSSGTEVVLLFGAEIGHRAVQRRQKKNGIITETGAARRRMTDDTRNVALHCPKDLARLSH